MDVAAVFNKGQNSLNLNVVVPKINQTFCFLMVVSKAWLKHFDAKPQEFFLCFPT
jgi:hypothetical protein